MTDQRTKTRLAVSEFQSASRAKFEAERDFTRAHDQLGKLIDELISENEELRKLADWHGSHAKRAFWAACRAAKKEGRT